MAENKEPGPRAEALWKEPIGGKVLEEEEQSAGYIPSDLLCLDYEGEVMCEVYTMYHPHITFSWVYRGSSIPQGTQFYSL